MDVCCVWVGDKYSEEYVINLYNGVKNNTTLPFRFNVITDKPQIANKLPCRVIPSPFPDWNIRGIDLMNHRKAWWAKMYMFSPECEFHKIVMYFDLDLVIINNIDRFYNYKQKRFVILQDFNRQYIADYHVSNSSIMRFRPAKAVPIWEDFSKNILHNIQSYRGDQDFMTAYFAKNPKQKVWWPREWAMSWKWEVEKGGKRNNGTNRDSYISPDTPFIIPEDCSIVVCHGDPKPSEIHKKIKRYWLPKT